MLLTQQEKHYSLPRWKASAVCDWLQSPVVLRRVDSVSSALMWRCVFAAAVSCLASADQWHSERFSLQLMEMLTQRNETRCQSQCVNLYSAKSPMCSMCWYGANRNVFRKLLKAASVASGLQTGFGRLFRAYSIHCAYVFCAKAQWSYRPSWCRGTCSRSCSTEWTCLQLDSGIWRLARHWGTDLVATLNDERWRWRR